MFEVEQVHIQDDYMTDGHRLYLLGRPWGDGRRHIRRADGTWAPLEEGVVYPEPTILLPEGVLDRIVAEYRGTTPAQPATERHLEDAIKVRDRLLAMVEKRR